MITTPLIILICLNMLGICISLSEHGKPKTGKHNFVTTVIADILNYALIYWHSLVLISH